MIPTQTSLLLTLACTLQLAFAQNWPQGPGPNFDFNNVETKAPTAWSASLEQNVAWRTTLPETGQSTPVIWGDSVFLTTMKPVEADGNTKTGSDIVAYCLSASDGSIRWQRPIPGSYQTKLSAPFGDASSPSAVTDGKSVWFLNPTGQLACFDFDGNERWSKTVTSVSRTQPVLFEDKLIFHSQVYLPDGKGHFTHENANAPLEKWTQLQALDAKTGELVWLSKCGVNMGCSPLIQRLQDGSPVLVVGRGGGHGPPEPDGVSMISATTGETMWTLELPKFMATQSYQVRNDETFIFHGGSVIRVNAKGKVVKEISIVDKISVRRRENGKHLTKEETLKAGKRPITQNSNLLVGNYLYFRSYTRNYLGRLNLETNAVEHLELPLQVLREPGSPETTLWNMDQTEGVEEVKEKKFKKNFSYHSLRRNSAENSRGIQVMGDGRAVGNGWGHTASAVPTAIGNRLYIPLLSGLVFVIQADAVVLDETALLAINDLGPLGNAFSRSSISTAGGRVFARTIREVLAFE